MNARPPRRQARSTQWLLSICGAWALGASASRADQAPPTGTEPAPGGATIETEDRTLADAVEQVLESASGSDVAVAGRRLAELGAEVLPVLLDRLEEGNARADSAEAEERAVLTALERLGATAALAELERRLDEAPSRERRLVTLRVLEQLAGPGAFDLALRAAASEEEALSDGALPRALQEAAVGILRRHPGAVPSLEAHVRSASSAPAVAGALVRAACSVDSPEALGVLGRLLHGYPDLDPVLLGHVSRAARAASRPIDPFLLSRVRSFLWCSDPQLVRAALLALGELEDSESIEQAIDFLGHDSAALRDAAYWSLKRISRLNLPPDEERWRAWQETEARWFRERSDACLAQLRQRSPGPVFAALTELSERRYRRHTIAGYVESVLEHDVPGIRSLACRVLGQLASPVATPALVECLDDADAGVSQAAWVALKRITKLDLPPEREAWTAGLASSSDHEAP